MKIEIEIKPYDQMRYPTLGDYYYKEDGTLKLEVADTGNIFYNKLLLIHELIEECLTDKLDIDPAIIDDFDLQFEQERLAGMHTPDKEPGFDPRCPYLHEHALATGVEMLLCAHSGVNWIQYNIDLTLI